MKSNNADELSRPRNRRSSLPIRRRARELRREPTIIESFMWAQLQNRNLNGLNFRRQHPIGPFVADFFCAQHRLIVELDGPVHAKQQEYDSRRTRYLQEHAYRVIRFSHEDVLRRMKQVLNEIVNACRSPSSEQEEPCDEEVQPQIRSIGSSRFEITDAHRTPSPPPLPPPLRSGGRGA